MTHYCFKCGATMHHGVPPGDDHERWYCEACGYVMYESPATVVLVVAEADGRMLLIRRAQAPYQGCWAVPGGFVEKGESITRAAVRELEEETGVAVREDELIPFFISSVVATNQVYITFRIHLPQVVPLTLGAEASDGHWFSRADFPEREFWLPKLISAVHDFFDSVDSGRFQFYVSDWSEASMHNRAFDLMR